MEVEFLKRKLSKRKDSGILRSLTKNAEGIDFYSNDYLGLSKVPPDSTTDIPMGSTGSRLLSGNHQLFELAENFMSEYFQTESSLIFNSGYAANLAILSALGGKGDTIIFDEKAHASIKDGARLSHAKFYSFRHNSPESLALKLKQAKGNRFVVVESVYSMDGTKADLQNIARVCENNGAFLIVDEAHSTGIYGKYGEGFVVDCKLQEKIFARIHTFGKAIGRHGACICGSKTLIGYLINFARPFIYTTAMPPFAVFDIIQVFSYLKNNRQLIVALHENIDFFNSIVEKSTFRDSFISTQTPIQGFNGGDRQKTKSLSAYLNKKGFCLQPVLYPTVPENEERIRISIHSFNNNEEIHSLVSHIEKFMNT